MRNLLIPRKARTLLNYNFSTGTIADWTSFGSSSASITGGALVISGTGNTNFQDGYYLNTYVSRLERVRLKGTYTCTATKGGSSYGLGFGFQSVNTIAASKASAGAYFDYTTSAAFGGATGLRRIQNTTLTNPLSQGTASMTFNQNDVVNFEVEMWQNNITVYFNNVTQGQANRISYTYVVNTTSAAYNMPNTWCPAIFNVGLGGTVSNFQLETEVPLNPDIAFVGDSLTKGYYTETNDLNVSRFIEKLMERGPYAGLSYAVMGGASDKTADVLLGISELTTLAPKNVILNIGTNDLGGGISSATFQANYSSIVNQLVAAGSRVFPCLLWPRNDVDVSTAGWNPWLISTYGGGAGLNGGKLILDTYWILRAALNDVTFPNGLNDRFDDSPADGVHPSLHHQSIADAIYGATKNYLKFY